MSSVKLIDVRKSCHRRFACIGFLLAHLFWSASAAQPAEADLVLFEIPRQSLDSALTSFVREARVATLFPLELVQGKFANELRGRFPPNQALAILLLGTGLSGKERP
jgi:hypothetical protein